MFDLDKGVDEGPPCSVFLFPDRHAKFNTVIPLLPSPASLGNLSLITRRNR